MAYFLLSMPIRFKLYCLLIPIFTVIILATLQQWILDREGGIPLPFKYFVWWRMLSLIHKVNFWRTVIMYVQNTSTFLPQLIVISFFLDDLATRQHFDVATLYKWLWPPLWIPEVYSRLYSIYWESWLPRKLNETVLLCDLLYCSKRPVLALWNYNKIRVCYIPLQKYKLCKVLWNGYCNRRG